MKTKISPFNDSDIGYIDPDFADSLEITMKNSTEELETIENEE
jgi:hypothetical protein